MHPRVGLGYSSARIEVSSTRVDATTRSVSSDGSLVVSPALELSFPVGDFSLLAEGRYGLLVSEEPNSNGFVIGVGFGLPLY